MKYYKHINNNVMVFSNDERLNTLKVNDFMLDDNLLDYELLDTYRFVFVEKLDTCIGVSFECDITYYLSFEGSSVRKLYNFIKLLIKSYDINSIVDLLKGIEKHYLVEYQHQHHLHINVNDCIWCTDDEIAQIIEFMKNNNNIYITVKYRDMTNKVIVINCNGKVRIH